MSVWNCQYFRHLFCDSEPEHIQGFPDGPQGPGGPQAGVRCEGCGRPTSLDDWVQVVSDVNREVAS